MKKKMRVLLKEQIEREANKQGKEVIETVCIVNLKEISCPKHCIDRKEDKLT